LVALLKQIWLHCFSVCAGADEAHDFQHDLPDEAGDNGGLKVYAQNLTDGINPIFVVQHFQMLHDTIFTSICRIVQIPHYRQHHAWQPRCHLFFGRWQTIFSPVSGTFFG
jgi:hypothetical protein